jgi:shikimate kinase
MNEPASLPVCPPGDLVSAIALIGFMGAGKTTVGEALALRLGWRFIDLDRVVEKQAGRTIEQLFRERGEAEFRSLEYSCLCEVVRAPASERVVIALGGGAFIEAKIQDLLCAQRIPAIFLDADVEELFRRSQQPEVVRPLRRSLQQFRELYRQREPIYARASRRVVTDGREIADIVKEIISGLKLVPLSGVTQ